MYSISDEIHQIYVPGRGFEMHDILLDNIGALMGIVLLGSVKAFFYLCFGERLLTKK
jgi:VanZ family protein